MGGESQVPITPARLALILQSHQSPASLSHLLNLVLEAPVPDPEAVRLLLQRPGLDPNADARFEHEPPLHQCARQGGGCQAAVECALLLLGHPGIAVNGIASSGLTALAHACLLGDQELACALLRDQRTDLHHANFEGITPLQAALTDPAPKLPLVRAFLEAPGFGTQPSRAAEAVLELAELEGAQYDPIFCLLLGHPAVNLNHEAHDGETILSRLCRTGNLERIRLLLAQPRMIINTKVPVNLRLVRQEQIRTQFQKHTSRLIYPVQLAALTGRSDIELLVAKYSSEPLLVRAWLQADVPDDLKALLCADSQK